MILFFSNTALSRRTIHRNISCVAFRVRAQSRSLLKFQRMEFPLSLPPHFIIRKHFSSPLTERTAAAARIYYAKKPKRAEFDVVSFALTSLRTGVPHNLVQQSSVLIYKCGAVQRKTKCGASRRKPERSLRRLRCRVRFISVYSSSRSLCGVARSSSMACWSARLRSKRNSMRSRVFHAVLSRIPVT